MNATKPLLMVIAALLAVLSYQNVKNNEPKSAESASMNSEPASNPSPGSAPEYALSQDVDKLNSMMNPLQKKVQTIQERLNEADFNKTPDTAEPPSPTDPTERELAQEEQRLYFATIESNMSMQEEDEDLYKDLSQKLDIENNPISGVTVESLHCGTTICRLDVNLNGSEGAESLQGEFRDRISDIFNAGAIDEDELGRTIVYLAKDESAFEARDAN